VRLTACEDAPRMPSRPSTRPGEFRASPAPGVVAPPDQSGNETSRTYARGSGQSRPRARSMANRSAVKLQVPGGGRFGLASASAPWRILAGRSLSASPDAAVPVAAATLAPVIGAGFATVTPVVGAGLAALVAVSSAGFATLVAVSSAGLATLVAVSSAGFATVTPVVDAGLAALVSHHAPVTGGRGGSSTVASAIALHSCDGAPRARHVTYPAS
jgi:hypothetical protein